MKYTKKTGSSGAWIDKDTIENGTLVKIVADTEPREGEFGTQNVTKVRVKGAEQSVNANLNQCTINGLIDAFGDDSKDWIGKVLTFQKEKMNVGGRRVTAMYLVPDGYVLSEDEQGYLVISSKTRQTMNKVDTVDTIEYPEEDINPEDMPF
mgnify:FL=1